MGENGRDSKRRESLRRLISRSMPGGARKLRPSNGGSLERRLDNAVHSNSGRRRGRQYCIGRKGGGEELASIA